MADEATLEQQRRDILSTAEKMAAIPLPHARGELMDSMRSEQRALLPVIERLRTLIEADVPVEHPTSDRVVSELLRATNSVLWQLKEAWGVG